MASFIIKPKDDDHLKLQNDAGNDIVEIKNDDKVLYVSRDSANAEVAIESYHDTEATTPKLTMRKGDGSAASPALVDDNAVLGTISFQGHDGTNFEEGAKIEARVDGTAASNDMPTELTFWTTPDGTNAAVERVVIDDTGTVTVKRDSANAEVAIESYHDTEATTPKLTMRKSDGSAASPALVDDNAVLGTISFQGNDGGAGAWEEGAKIEARVDGTAASNDMPGELSFWTTPDGANTSVQRVTIDDAGNVGVGNDGPAGSGKFVIKGNGTSTGNTFITTDSADAATFYVQDNGDVTIKGDIVFSTAGKGVCLGVTSNTDGNTLDDYEEGGWEPSGSWPNAGDSYGRYTKVGNMVTCWFVFRVANNSGATNAGLTGLPFAASASWSETPMMGSIMNEQDLDTWFAFGSDSSASASYQAQYVNQTITQNNRIWGVLNYHV